MKQSGHGDRRQYGRSVAVPANGTASAPHILVIDDDRMMLKLMADVLQPAGLWVRTAKDGCSAIEALKADGAISVVILDWEMPGLSGERVLDALVAIRPDIRAIVSSGGDLLEVRSAFAGREVVQFLPKPFRIQTLVTAVKSALQVSGGAIKPRDGCQTPGQYSPGTGMTFVESGDLLCSPAMI